MARLSVPTKARLPSSLRVDASNPAVIKSLSRLSRDSLVSLALDWLDDAAVHNAPPYLRIPNAEEDDEDADEDMDDLYPPLRSVEEVRDLYEVTRQQKGSRRDVVSRITEGDWRQGLNLYQLAMADCAYLEEHPGSQKWSTYSILPLRPPSTDAGEDEVLKVDAESLKIPRFHPSTFLQNLQEQVLPDVKAHYHFHRLKAAPLLLLRVFVVDSPYNSDLSLSGPDQASTAALFNTARTIFLAFPDGSPSLYISKSQSAGPTVYGESKSLRQLIVDGVPKALSRPRERFTLKATNLTSRNLDALLEKKGPGRGSAAGGGWSIYTDDKTKKSPLDPILPLPPLSAEASVAAPTSKRTVPLTEGQRERKRMRLIARGRFGSSALMDDGKGIEKLEVVLQDPFPAAASVELSDEDEDEGVTTASRRRSKVDITMRDAAEDNEDGSLGQAHASQWTPAVKVQFNGTHVFAGIRQLVAAGIIDGDRMPGWMTGEEGVTTGIVRDGRIRGHKGSGV